MDARTPPQNLEAEQSVLGSILLDNEVFAQIEGTLSAEHFYKESHRKLWRACERLFRRNEPMDLVTLTEELRQTGELEAVAKKQSECFAAGVLFARTEGIIPAPEPTHALAAAIEEAHRCTETGEEKVILTALCGHGHFDLAAYDAYLSGRMTDEDVSADRLRAGLSTVPAV